MAFIVKNHVFQRIFAAEEIRRISVSIDKTLATTVEVTIHSTVAVVSVESCVYLVSLGERGRVFLACRLERGPGVVCSLRVAWREGLCVPPRAAWRLDLCCLPVKAESCNKRHVI